MVPGDDSPGFGESFTMDEIEEGAGATVVEKPDLSKVMADGDDVPEAYRGKSFSEVIKIAETARTTMNESVAAARTAAEAARDAAAAIGTRQEAPPPPPKELTREEIKALYDEDPMAALDVIQDQAMRRVSAHLEERIAPLTSGTMSAAENWAKQEFPEEFELFGDKIKAMIDSVPNKQIFSGKKGWEDAIAYVRGQKGNFEKLMDHRNNKGNSDEAASARERERAAAGFTGRSTTTARQREAARSADSSDMNDTEKSIAQRFIDDGTFKDMAEYRRWQKMGG